MAVLRVSLFIQHFFFVRVHIVQSVVVYICVCVCVLFIVSKCDRASSVLFRLAIDANSYAPKILERAHIQTHTNTHVHRRGVDGRRLRRRRRRRRPMLLNVVRC